MLVLVVVAVRMTVAVVVRVTVVVPVAAPAPAGRQHRGADGDDEQAGDERQPGVERLRDDEAREQERDEAEREDPRGVCDGDDAAQEHRVDRAPARADEIPGDDRLAVAGCERVRSTPERGDEQRHEDHADREVAVRDQRLEAPALVLRRGRAGELGRHPSPPPGSIVAAASWTSSGERSSSFG